MTVPPSPTGEPPDAFTPAPAAGVSSQPPRDTIILAVDDDPRITTVIALVLREAGYRVLVAPDGPAALEIARRTPEIHLLLTDLDMPTMRGDELVRLFTAIHPHAAIALISSSPDPLPGDFPHEYLAKPFTIAALHQTVQRALRRRRPG